MPSAVCREHKMMFAKEAEALAFAEPLVPRRYHTWLRSTDAMQRRSRPLGEVLLLVLHHPKPVAPGVGRCAPHGRRRWSKAGTDRHCLAHRRAAPGLVGRSRDTTWRGNRARHRKSR